MLLKDIDKFVVVGFPGIPQGTLLTQILYMVCSMCLKKRELTVPFLMTNNWCHTTLEEYDADFVAKTCRLFLYAVQPQALDVILLDGIISVP